MEALGKGECKYMEPIKINGGIYVDWDCSGIKKIGSGYFIPDFFGTNDKDDAYCQDLQSFLKKWFTPAPLCGSYCKCESSQSL